MFHCSEISHVIFIVFQAPTFLPNLSIYLGMIPGTCTCSTNMHGRLVRHTGQCTKFMSCTQIFLEHCTMPFLKFQHDDPIARKSWSCINSQEIWKTGIKMKSYSQGGCRLKIYCPSSTQEECQQATPIDFSPMVKSVYISWDSGVNIQFLCSETLLCLHACNLLQCKNKIPCITYLEQFIPFTSSIYSAQLMCRRH